MTTEVHNLLKKYAIETDESLTECVERTIDGWKQRCLKAEAHAEKLEAALRAWRKADSCSYEDHRDFSREARRLTAETLEGRE